MGDVVAANLAVHDFNPGVKGMKVEVIYADHQNRADIGSNIVNSWFDVVKVDMVVDVPNSGIALAVSEIAKQRNKVFLDTGAATADLTGPRCNANTIHWVYDTWNLANGTGKAMVQSGGNTWFFISADYAFGYALERDTAAVVEANGGKVLGKVRHPLNTNDFSSFLLQAQTSHAKVIGLANSGTDTVQGHHRQAERGSRRGVGKSSSAISAHRARTGDFPARATNAGGARRACKGRCREMVADHQGGWDQTRVTP